MVAKIKVKIDFKQKRVTDAVDRANSKALFEAGGFVRTVSRRSIRNRPSGRKRGRKRLISDAQKEAFLELVSKNDPRVVEAIQRSKENQRARRPASPRGTPPFTGRGRALRKSIQFEVASQKDDVIVGPTFKILSTIGKRHEFGGRFDGKNFPRRAFMAPALEKFRSRLPNFWARSVKS